MREGFRTALRGTRPIDWVLAGALTILGVVMMVENITVSDEKMLADIEAGSMYHLHSTHTVWMLPLWLCAPIAVLFWRRNVLAVTGIALAVVALHDLVFGWQGRCGSGLPLAFVLAFLCAITVERAKVWLALLLSTGLVCAVLVVDAITGPDVIGLGLPVTFLVFGVGRAVRHRTEMNRELSGRNEELQDLRDRRAALEVADDRAQLSQQLDGLLQHRLEQLTYAAESAEGLDADGSRALLESIEAESRTTLDDMREIVGLLRGGDVALAPAPTVAHLDALLARHTRADARLTVSGDPRSLPATVELSAYRIVEHLVTALADQPGARIDVGVRFDADAVEIRVRGPVAKGADLKAAAARARERAKLLGGSVELKVAKGEANAVAQLPVTV